MGEVFAATNVGVASVTLLMVWRNGCEGGGGARRMNR